MAIVKAPLTTVKASRTKERLLKRILRLKRWAEALERLSEEHNPAPRRH